MGQLNCTSGQVPKWNGSAWACAEDNTGAGTPSPTVANLDGTSSPGTSDEYSSGDHKHGIATGAISGTMIVDGAVSGAKIGDGQVTNAKITGPIDGSKISSTGLNADLLDGLHASTFASSTHNHDAAYVNVTGDTMTGTLNVPSLIASQVSSNPGMTGEDLSISAANGMLGSGGAVTITGGTAGSLGGGGGTISIRAGSGAGNLGGTGPAGIVSITAGGGHNAAGGDVLLNAGNGGGMIPIYSGGSIILSGGAGSTGGGVIIRTSGSKPGCSSGNRGMLWYTQSGDGIKDSLEICAKDATDAYAWQALW